MIEATRTVLGLLAKEQGVLSIEESAREIGGWAAPLDAVGELARAGLVNRVNKRFVWASNAALRAAQITGEGT